MSKGWLIEGLRDAKREADACPELRERVASYPSGFLHELQADERAEAIGSPDCADHEQTYAVVARARPQIEAELVAQLNSAAR
jgi:hypothetical protein